MYTSLATKAVALLLTATHLHVPGPQQYGPGPPCNDNPYHQLCAGQVQPVPFTWQGWVVVGILIAAACLILVFCIGFAYRSINQDRKGVVR